MIMLFNQLLDMPHLSGGWIIFDKGEMLTNMDVNKLCIKFERNKLFGTFLGSFISAHETNTLHVAFVFLFSIVSILLMNYMSQKMCANTVNIM